ncbi:MAG TPA: winged helix DNA-binding domain-containing protein [Actinocrinis sp.]|nr:winged helix DNA-binding domain-containing protein [Actinocrinis sp.]
MTGHRLTTRELNRATLARQLLLERAPLGAYDAVAHLAGMQAQAPLSPYVGLWTRLTAFTPDDLVARYQDRSVARLALMRGTVHLVTAEDASAWRALVEPVIVRGTNSAFGRHYKDLDREELAKTARLLTEQEPRTFAELGPLLAERFPDRDPAALAQAARAHVPLVQVPPRGLWGHTGRVAHTPAEAWFGRTLTPDATPDAMILRYLAAFGPASVMDAQAWSGLTRLKEAFDRLRPQLKTFRDEHDTELFDLPDAPRPPAETPAPPRFLPEYDNLLFSHADRTRVVPAHAPAIPLFPGIGSTRGMILTDGTWSGLWRFDKPARETPARLTVSHFTPLTSADEAALTAEARNLLALLTPGAAAPVLEIAPA